MTPSELSAYAEQFLALRRTMIRVNPRRGGQDRRRLRYNEKLIRSFARWWLEPASSTKNSLSGGIRSNSLGSGSACSALIADFALLSPAIV
jgi:hypothetical protein